MMPADLRLLIREIEGHRHIFNFTRNRLGQDAVRTTASAIQGYMQSGLDEDGQPFAPLAALYAAWKARRAPGRPISILWGLMSQPDELEGRLWIVPEQIRQTCSLTAEAADEAQWFQDPVKPNQPPRKFYAFNNYALAALDQLFTDHFDRQLR